MVLGATSAIPLGTPVLWLASRRFGVLELTKAGTRWLATDNDRTRFTFLRRRHVVSLLGPKRSFQRGRRIRAFEGIAGGG
jgi:hypothetical protein